MICFLVIVEVRGDFNEFNSSNWCTKRHIQRPLEAGEHRKIVFWMNKEKEFAEDIEQIVLDGVTIHTLTDCNQFYTKFLLEVENPAEHYLIYTNEELTVEENWLVDTVLCLLN